MIHSVIYFYMSVLNFAVTNYKQVSSKLQSPKSTRKKCEILIPVFQIVKIYLVTGVK